MKLRKFIALFLVFASVALGTNVYADTAEQKEQITASDEEKTLELSEEYQAYKQVAGYVADLYIDDSLTKEDVIEKGISKLMENNEDMLILALKAALSSLDDYSEFFTAKEYKDYQSAVNRTFYGLGIAIQQNGDYVEIVGFAEENSMAEQAGFMPGDKIYKVDGVDVTGESLQEVRNRMIGELGTTVNITVLRDGKEVNLVGTRTEVRTSTVTGGVLNGNIGYIKIASFGTQTSSEFTDVLNTFREKGVKDIILDLRNNTGGLVTAATDIAKEIVPAGKIVDVVYRDEKYNVSYESELSNPEFKFVTLVNGNTASAAEILSSAIQDSGIGELVGETTFGKAVVQTVHQLNNGMVLKLTTGQYITRNGNEINHIGLTPDLEVKNYTEKIDATQYTPMDFRTRVSLGDKGQNIKAAKERLYLLKYYMGKTDNDVFYSDLQEAVSEFQKDSGICVNGVLDIVTQVKLEETFEKLETEVDRQLKTAYEMLGGKEEDLYQN